MARAWLSLLALVACAPKVQVPVPAMPAVSLDATRVAVVSSGRDCTAIADALVAELHHTPGLVVDPRAAVRLEVTECARPLLPVQVVVEIGGDVDRRRLSVEGSAHALVVVRKDGHAEAHLIGASRTTGRGEWGERNASALSRDVQQALTDAVARDLAEQIRPVPRLVERRLYANPAAGTPQELFNLAVAAEMSGQLGEARRLAALSQAERPNPRVEAYLDEIDARLSRYPLSEVPTP